MRLLRRVLHRGPGPLPAAVPAHDPRLRAVARVVRDRRRAASRRARAGWPASGITDPGAPRPADRDRHRSHRPADLERPRRRPLDPPRRRRHRDVLRPRVTEATKHEEGTEVMTTVDADRRRSRRSIERRGRRRSRRPRTQRVRRARAARSTRDDWSKPTDCPAWDVRAMAVHVLGGMEAFASLPRVRPPDRAPGSKAAGDRPFIDGMTAVQVRERADCRPRSCRAARPRGAAARARARRRRAAAAAADADEAGGRRRRRRRGAWATCST